jgi:hypothetical protein
MDETAIRQRIRDKLQQGELPVGALVSSDPSIAVNVGVGTGTPCSACDEPIRTPEARLIYQGSLKRVIQFHDTCDRLWQEECERYRREHP